MRLPSTDGTVLKSYGTISDTSTVITIEHDGWLTGKSVTFYLHASVAMYAVNGVSVCGHLDGNGTGIQMRNMVPVRKGDVVTFDLSNTAVIEELQVVRCVW